FDPPQDDQQSGGGKSAEALASGGSSGGSSSGGRGKKPKGQKQRYEKQGKQFIEMTKDKTTHGHDQAIDYKTGTHTFSAPEGMRKEDGTPRAGGPWVKILGDKFTQGFGEFTKQVTADHPTQPKHLTTKA